ncbi:MAG: T9SS type A sorting domain-containing protein, partial [Fibrobacter sp.]|nr:T9SS type A sorting domain-containing protein [Fibrobacter sp.]
SQEVSFAATNAWTTWETAEINLELAAGKNDILFATVGGNDGPNLDQFDLTLVKASADTSKKDTIVEEDSTTRLVANGLPGETRVRLLPNVVVLEGFGLASSLETRLFDVNGVCVLKLIGVTNIDIHSLPKGLYVLKVNGNGHVYKKIIQHKN